METKDFKLTLKSGIGDGGQFTALIAEYGVEDLANDVIEKGAFTRSIQQQGAGFPLHWAHKMDEPIGIATIEDGKRGPIATATIDLEDPDGGKAYRRIKSGIVKAVSIGFTLPNTDAVTWKGAVRHIHELKLLELSVVTVPAQPGARILSVKSLPELSLALDGFNPDTLGPAEFAELRTIQGHVKRLLEKAPAAHEDTALLADLRGLAALVGRVS